MELKKFCADHNIPVEELGPIGEVSDGFHTFDSLYHQRLILFAALVSAFPNKAWKSHRHSDGEAPFGGGWFIVGIQTPEGQYTYHYEDKDWDIFQCPEVEKAPEWDGHTDKDVTRLLSLFKPEPGTQSDWAEREVALAIAAEKKMAEGTNDWAYGAACYGSALRAHQSLSRDGHSGYSIQITKGILNRLIDGKCLTPIEDTPDIWTDISESFSKDDKRKHYQCNRMSSLFKEVAEDGTGIGSIASTPTIPTTPIRTASLPIWSIRYFPSGCPISRPVRSSGSLWMSSSLIQRTATSTRSVISAS